jgi:microcin C transport system substrate-binding protein
LGESQDQQMLVRQSKVAATMRVNWLWKRAFALCALAVFGTSAPACVIAQQANRYHALSLVSQPRFGPDFKHFDWVNPAAPKGGTIHMWALGTFDTFNQFNIKGNKAIGTGLVYDTLMFSSPDEPSTEYCLVCEWVSYPTDYSSVSFGLRKEARFNDGAPVTVEDLIFSLEVLKKYSPFYAQYYKNVTRAEKIGEHEVRIIFDTKGNRELPQIVGQLLYVLPKHFWEGKAANGEARDFGATTLEIPLGSGPYRIKEFQTGRSIAYERVADWWAKDLPVARGMWNFTELRFDYFRDTTPAFEAFKAGQIDYYSESSAKQWATAYNFEAVKQGWVKKEQIRDRESPPMQAFVMNLRRDQFKDVRVREAFIDAFDFEWANKNLFYGLYARVTNYFGEEDLRSSGLPTGKELAILESVRDYIPPQCFTSEYKLPVNPTSEDLRKHLAAAAKLLAEAGWTPKNGVLTNAAGATLTAEFLIYDSQFERVVQPYVHTLERLGVKATLRVVDPAQYERRKDDFDYDIIVDNFPQSVSPGNEQREFWGSASAAIKGSRNSIGVANPGIDALIEKIIFSKDREELAAATRALDRVLLWNNFVVPQWYSPYDRIAYWDKFGRPAKLPSRSTGFTQVWWVDEAAVKKLNEAQGR